MMSFWNCQELFRDFDFFCLLRVLMSVWAEIVKFDYGFSDLNLLVAGFRLALAFGRAFGLISRFGQYFFKTLTQLQQTYIKF